MNNQETTEVIGRIKHIIYQSQDGTYSVAAIKTKDGKKMTVCGNNVPNNPRLTYKFIGILKNHTKYGNSFNVISSEPVVSSNKDEIIAYLSSGIFKGVGRTLAARIYETFGSQTKEILEKIPDRLYEVKGISEKKVKSIIKNIREVTYLSTLVAEFSVYGMTLDQCSSLAKKYGVDTSRIVKNDPYCMVSDIKMPFVEADRIALLMGINPNSETRVVAGCKYIMNEVLMSGDTGCEIQSFGKRVSRLFRGEIPVSIIESIIIKLIKNRDYRCTKLQIDDVLHQYIFPAFMFEWEKEIAIRLVELNSLRADEIIAISEQIMEYERKHNIKFDELQKKAIEEALSHTLTVITGGLIISRQGIRIGTLFRSIDFLLRTTGSQLRSTCV